MKYSKLYGLSVQEKNWVPAPSYVLRRERILNLCKNQKRGRGLEFGCGSGTLVYDLNKMGFEMSGLEFSKSALSLAKYVNGDKENIMSSPNKNWLGTMDYVMAFEVLEHIDDHIGVLKEWVTYLNIDGLLLISVPAHPKKWNSSDTWAGHFRRYKRQDLHRLVEDVGFEIVEFQNYGFPIQNLIRPIRARIHKKNLEAKKRLGEIESSKRSGTERSTEMKLWKYQDSFFGRMILRVGIFIQTLFKNSNLGNGYLVLCKRVK